MSEMEIIVQDVRKTYRAGLFGRKTTEALRGVSLSVGKGEIFGLLGPNGAGKTTLLNILACQLIKDGGSVKLFGKELREPAPAVLKTRLNMCSGNPNFPWSLTVYENLKFYSLLYGKCGAVCRSTVEKTLDMFELRRYRNTQYDELSSGNKQKLSLAKALINDPEILYLDEPTMGLDPDASGRIRDTIRGIRREKGITVILTTHYMKEAEELCDRIAFIKDGMIKATGTRQELLDRTGKPDLEEAFIELAG